MPRYYVNISKEEFLEKTKDILKTIGHSNFSKDLSKVEFGWENCNKVDDFGENGYVEIVPGFHIQLMFAGEDSEMPVHFAIYWNGDILRAYIPKNGNPWDKEEKIAWDYETWVDEHKTDDPMDYNKMIEDITKRIKRK